MEEKRLVRKYAVRHKKHPWYIVKDTVTNDSTSLIAVIDESHIQDIKLFDTIGEAMKIAVQVQERYDNKNDICVFPIDVCE